MNVNYNFLVKLYSELNNDQNGLYKCRLPNILYLMATWRNGYAEDCKSLYPGSIPGVASKISIEINFKKSKL